MWNMRLYQRKHTGVWYVGFERGKSRSLKTKDRAEARRLFKVLEKEALAGRLREITGAGASPTLAAYRAEFVSWAEAVQTPSTFRANRLALDKLSEVAGETTRLAELGLKHIDSLVRHNKKRGVSPASINNYIRHARSALNKAVDWEYLVENPLHKAKEIPVPKRRPRYLSPEQITTLLSSIEDRRLRALVAAYLATGRRRSELLALCWEDVDWERGLYYVRRAKRNLSRYYPMSSTLRAILEHLGPQRTGPVFDRWKSPDTVSKKIKAALRAAGFEDCRLHDLRHTFAVRYISERGSLRHLQELLGHTEYRTTEIYAHVVQGEMNDEVERVDLGPLDL